MKLFLNHKMNLTLDQIKEYIIKLNEVKEKIVVFPSNIYLKEFIDNDYITGIQNIYYKDVGAYTGEISPQQAKSLEVEYVLIGHSERRIYDNDEIINKKIKKALENHLQVILCIGENEFEDETRLYQQITAALKGINEEVIIAYEPVYAIGTGITLNYKEIEKKISYIKSIVNAKVLYGGSVSSKNIKELNEVSLIDGYLLGTASLDPEEVIKILEVVQ